MIRKFLAMTSKVDFFKLFLGVEILGRRIVCGNWDQHAWLRHQSQFQLWWEKEISYLSLSQPPHGIPAVVDPRLIKVSSGLYLVITAWPIGAGLVELLSLNDWGAEGQSEKETSFHHYIAWHRAMSYLPETGFNLTVSEIFIVLIQSI